MGIGLLASDEKNEKAKKREFYEDLLTELKESRLGDLQVAFLTHLIEIAVFRRRIIDLYDGSLTQPLVADLDYIREKLGVPTLQGQHQVVLFLCVWNDKIGPLTEKYYPPDDHGGFSVDKVAQNLFNAVAGIYGEPKSVESSQGMLLNLEHIQRQASILFGGYYAPEARGKQRSYMLGVIAPQINQPESIKIREIFGEIAGYVKIQKEWDIQEYWKQIAKTIAPRPFHYFSR